MLMGALAFPLRNNIRMAMETVLVSFDDRGTRQNTQFENEAKPISSYMIIIS